jgi:hypothetical protein
MGYKTIPPIIKYGQTDLVESGASKAIRDMGAEIAHGTSVPAFRMVRRINNIFMAENITKVSFRGAILTKIFMTKPLNVNFLEMRKRICYLGSAEKGKKYL